MSTFMISAAFLLAAGQPPAETAAPAPEPTTAAAPEAEPKMICKYEYATGSRVQKHKVCRPENASSADFMDSKLSRDMARNGDLKAPYNPGSGGGGVSSGAGIGN